MISSYEKIGPHRARILLKNNHCQRAINAGIVSYLVKQMIEGCWVEKGDTIGIEKTGALLDGQHRLMAIIEANMTIQFTVCVM